MSRSIAPNLAVLASALALTAAAACLAADLSSAYPDGAATFQTNCAVCHGPRGAGQPSLAPPLTSFPARYATIDAGRRQLAMTVLYGMFGEITVGESHYDFKMPEFPRLDDQTLATVLNFVVFDLGSAPKSTKPLAPEEIAAGRSHPVEGAEVRKHRAQVLAVLGL